MYEGTQRWRIKARRWITEYAGGECSNPICSYKKYIGNLSFHHLDPNTKIDTVSRMVNSCKSWDKIILEADKCVLLCHNCHGEFHAGLITAPAIDIQKRKEKLKELEASKPIPKNHKFHYCICAERIPQTMKFCSAKCASKGQEKIQWPDNLHELVLQSSQRAVAKMLGVSDKAVTKRLRNHQVVP